MFKKRRHISSTAFFLFLMFVSILFIYLIVDRNLRPTILGIAEAQAKLIVSEAVSVAVQQKVAEEKVRYQDLVTVHKDANGKIVMMQANTVTINQISTDLTIEVVKALRQIELNELKISLGQALGSHFLANYGPRINVSVLPVGSVKVLVSDSFSAEGINQTRHQIKLDLNTDVKIVIPLYEKDITVHTVVPLTESIIVGDVPETWVSIPGGIIGGIGGEALLGSQ
ncbi:sporulation protein YunB [Desulfofalx alkaliphila]|uniref:sporulation protein YunB n=1 Tax=Desulfofalx alkaliphila TaxID=105483 RepID=UPI0004E1DC37|nr:sporulation protein YunB [Desulfofalx alkaliphila]